MDREPQVGDLVLGLPVFHGRPNRAKLANHVLRITHVHRTTYPEPERRFTVRVESLDGSYRFEQGYWISRFRLL